MESFIDDMPDCPACGSDRIHWSASCGCERSGSLISGVCAKCGYAWSEARKPDHASPEQAKG